MSRGGENEIFVLWFLFWVLIPRFNVWNILQMEVFIFKVLFWFEWILYSQMVYFHNSFRSSC